MKGDSGDTGKGMRRMVGIRGVVMVCVTAIFCCLVVPCWAQDAGKASPVEKYKPGAYVNDFAELIDPKVQLEIDAVCTDLAAKKQTKMVIVTVSSLEGMSIKEFSTELFNQWEVSPKDTNRGVMVLLSRGDRQWRLTVGSGLQSVLTDEDAAKLGREMLPMLKKGEYGEALLYAANRIRDEVVEKVAVGKQKGN
jgi:uncharacterized protein